MRLCKSVEDMFNQLAVSSVEGRMERHHEKGRGGNVPPSGNVYDFECECVAAVAQVHRGGALEAVYTRVRIALSGYQDSSAASGMKGTKQTPCGYGADPVPAVLHLALMRDKDIKLASRFCFFGMPLSICLLLLAVSTWGLNLLWLPRCVPCPTTNKNNNPI